MQDSFGRHISYLRVSVTDRCDFRCVYCMSEHMSFLPKKEMLSLDELERLANIFVAKGVERLRITGGEPLVRKNVMSLLSGWAAGSATGSRNSPSPPMAASSPITRKAFTTRASAG